MHKVVVVIMALLVVASVGLVGCAAEEKAPTEIKPCVVELAMVYPIWTGKESVSLVALTEVSNPNDFAITLESLEFAVTAEGMLLGEGQIPDDFFIPAGGKVALKMAFVVPVGDLIGAKMFAEGLSAPQASVAALPLWKSLGGKLFADALEPAWEPLEDTKLTFEAKGVAYISGQGLSLSVSFTDTWQEVT